MTALARELLFSSAAGDAAVDELLLTRVEGTARLSALYEYGLELTSHDDQGLSVESIEAWMKAPCRFSCGDVTVSGIVNEVKLLPSATASPLRYRARLVPTLWVTTQSIQSRVFMDKRDLAAGETVAEIVSEVLNEHSIAFELTALAETYPANEYTVQYAESDFAFISRLMEHYGLFYYFDQRPDGEVMILGDASAAFRPSELHGTLGFSATGAGLDTWIAHVSRTHRPRTATVVLRDYNWRTPFMDANGHMTERQLQLRSEHAADEATGRGLHWTYGDHFKDPAEGALLARVRAEAELVGRETYEATVCAAGLDVGQTFEATGMPIGDLERAFLVTGSHLAIDAVLGDGTSDYRQTIEAIPAEVPFRPARTTPKPCIPGFMNAVVDGEVHGTAAPIDELGRYKVIMPYDRAAKSGGKASRWVRMAQSSAGPDYGMHLPLHIGTEVAIVHMGGDPDRPVIMGSVPNVDTRSPVIQDNATMSRIRTRGDILFELEDDA